MALQRKKIFLLTICAIGLILVITLSTVFSRKSYISKKTNDQSVLLISLDGFRFDYLQRGVSPNLLKFAKSGVQAEFLQSQFPTKTFPNHYTIVTGLYPESHGIVENTFFDKVFNETFSLGSKFKENPKWWHGEPIWVTAKKQGYKSAAFFWPGSDVESEEKRPNYWKMYNRSVPFLERIDQVVSWLKLDDKSRPTMTLLYFEEPDSAGHSYGPDSDEVNFAIKKTDEYFGILLEKLKSNKLTENLNIIVVSDHGMATENTSAIIYIDKGLYPESHGIVENTFFDKVFNETFSLGSKFKENPKWWHGEPIWVTAKKQGYKSAAFFWPGSDVESEEKRPNYWKMYNRSVPFLERIDQVVSWLKLDDKSRPSMTLLYFEEPDSAGHSYGPDSDEVNSAIKKTDEYFGILLEKLKSNKLTENLNIIVLSDHGMATENTSAIIYIDKILGGLHGLSVVGRNAGSMVYSDILKNISINCHKNVVVMKKDDNSIPVRMHFSNNRRIGDIIITPKIPWVLQVRYALLK